MEPADRWLPERFFYSHATSDDRLTAIVKGLLEGAPERHEVYVAERGLVGRPLMQKLRDEMLACNAVVVGWTTSASSRSSEIISFEMGMAFSLGLPIYVLRTGCLEMPWFFSQLTDYANVSTITENTVRDELSRIEPFTFSHPVDLVFPAEREPGKDQSRNLEVVRQDGRIELGAGFDGIVHFTVTNRRLRAERDVRLTLQFPAQVAVLFDAGSLDGSTGVQRNEVFEMWSDSLGRVRIFWASLPLEPVVFELHLTVPADAAEWAGYISCTASSENVTGVRRKDIPLSIMPSVETRRSE